nr:adenosine deaminase [Endozoicomonas sp.]
AIVDAQSRWGISVLLILSLLKHTTEEECIEVLTMADGYPGDFVALGMASTEMGNPPEKFQRLFQLGRERGYRLQTHAGEEGSADVIWGSLRVMQAERIDHGVRCTDDPQLVDYLCSRQIPLTVCPLSNVRLRVFDKMADHNIIELLKKGILVTVNSDDPTYFGGFLNANYQALVDAFNLDKEDVLALVKNGFRASYLPEDRVQKFLDELDQMEAG